MPKNSGQLKRHRSIIGLFDLLEKVGSGDHDFRRKYGDITAALSSQAKLAAYSNNDHGISSCSLNTLKASANKWLPGGFAELDRLRIAAQRRVQAAVLSNKSTASQARPTPPTPGSKKYLKEKVRVLNAENEQQREDLVLLTQAIIQALDLAKYYSGQTQNPDLVARCTRQRREILTKLGMSIADNVLSFPG